MSTDVRTHPNGAASVVVQEPLQPQQGLQQLQQSHAELMVTGVIGVVNVVQNIVTLTDVLIVQQQPPQLRVQPPQPLKLAKQPQLYHLLIVTFNLVMYANQILVTLTSSHAVQQMFTNVRTLPNGAVMVLALVPLQPHHHQAIVAVKLCKGLDA